MRLSAIVAGVLALALPATAAGATPQLRELRGLTTSAGLPAPSTDGHRFLLVNRAAGTIAVFDTVTRETREVAVDRDCSATDATRNAALVNCTDRVGPYVLDLRAGTMWAPFGVRPRTPSEDSVTSYFKIGRYWMQGGYCSSAVGKCHTVWSNWRTRNAGDTIDEHDDLADPRDLNSPTAAVGPRNNWSTVVSEGRYRLWDAFTTVKGGVRVRLLLSDGRRRADLGPISTFPSLSAGLVSWRSGDTVRTHDVRTRTSRAWRFPRAGVKHTRDHVFAVRVDPDGGQRVFWTRVPR